MRLVLAAACIYREPITRALDEPVAAIDSMKMNIVNKLTLHDLSTAYYVEIATLYRGCLIEYGPAKQIMDNSLPELR